MSKQERFLDLSEAAEFLKVSKSSLRRWSNSGILACYRIGVRAERRFLASDLLDFVRRNPVDVSQHPRINKHVCTNFKDRDEQWQLFRPFLRSHLDDHSAVVYLYQGDNSRVRNWLSDEESVAEMIRDDRFKLIAAGDSYLRDSHFDGQRMLRFWQSVIDDFKAKNINRLLLTGEMDWATLGAPGSDQLIRYEKELDDFLKSYPDVTVVCQYSLIDFPAAVIFDSVCLHPTVLPAAS